jgi:hypothetical protein
MSALYGVPMTRITQILATADMSDPNIICQCMWFFFSMITW